MTALIRFTKPCDECGGTGGADTCVQCETPWGDKRYCCSPESWGAFKRCPSCVGGWLPDDATVRAFAVVADVVDDLDAEWPSWLDDTRRGLVAAARYQSEKGNE